MAGTRRIPRPEQTLLPAIPNEKNELADDPVGGFVTPYFIGTQHQFGIRAIPQHRAPTQQLAPQFLKVIYPPVHDQHEALVLVAVRLVFFE